MTSLALVGSVTLIHLLGVMSPGPDFIMTVRNSLTYSRKTGIWTSVGLGFGMAVHILYSWAGLALIISKSILIFNFIKFLGAGYLIYIGFKSCTAKSSLLEVGEQKKKSDITPFAAVKIGFLTNVLNPKATLFFLGLFTFVMSPTTPAYIVGAVSIIMIIDAILWFSLVAVFFTQERIRSVFEKFQGAFNKTFGGLLVLLGVKVALSEK